MGMAAVSLPAYQLARPITPLIDACLQGKAVPSNFEDYVEYWHTHELPVELHSFLGLSDRAYSLMLRHGDCGIIEEFLVCKRLGADFDAVWTPDKVPVLLNLCRKIDAAKAEFHDQTFLTNAATYEKLDILGEMIARKNEVSGLRQDIEYLYLDDGECYRCVAGFIGDESPMVDSNGLRLLIGDTVSYPDSDWSQMVILGMSGSPMLNQEELLARGAVKKNSCWNPDMAAARCVIFTVTHESCMERYQRRRLAETQQMGGMTLG